MVSTAEEVSRYLDEDLVLAEVLARGILNLRRAARWMIDKEEWDTTEEAVVSALRRFAGSSAGQRLDAARSALRGAGTGVRSRLALVTVPRSRSAYRKLRHLPNVVGPDETLVLLLGETRLRLLVDESRLDALVQALGREHVEGLRRPVAMVRASFPDGYPRPDAQGAAAIVLSALGQRGVAVLEAFSCLPDYAFVVDGGDGVQAYEVVSKLAGVA